MREKRTEREENGTREASGETERDREREQWNGRTSERSSGNHSSSLTSFARLSLPLFSFLVGASLRLLLSVPFAHEDRDEGEARCSTHGEAKQRVTGRERKGKRQELLLLCCAHRLVRSIEIHSIFASADSPSPFVHTRALSRSLALFTDSNVSINLSSGPGRRPGSGPGRRGRRRRQDRRPRRGAPRRRQLRQL